MSPNESRRQQRADAKDKFMERTAAKAATASRKAAIEFEPDEIASVFNDAAEN